MRTLVDQPSKILKKHVDRISPSSQGQKVATVENGIKYYMQHGAKVDFFTGDYCPRQKIFPSGDYCTFGKTLLARGVNPPAGKACYFQLLLHDVLFNNRLSYNVARLRDFLIHVNLVFPGYLGLKII